MRTRTFSPAHVFLCIVLLILVGFFVGEWILRDQVAQFTNLQKKNSDLKPDTILLKANEISFATDDHVELRGWLIQGKLGHPAVIIAHNYGSNRSEVLGNLESLIAELNKAGYFILLFDFRGHGDSGSRSALGLKESQDLKAALKAVIRYRQVEQRFGVLGIGMGALAAAQACEKLDEVKLLMFDSLYEDITDRVANTIMQEAPLTRYVRPLLFRSVDWNLRSLLDVQSTRMDLANRLPKLYPKAVVFIEKVPLRPEVKKLYEAAREPKEVMQFQETAVGTLMGKQREEYTRGLMDKINQYLPPVNTTPTIELKE